MITIEIPRTKFIVNVCPNNTAEATPVKIVAIVDEYFFKIVSAFIIVFLKHNYSLLAKSLYMAVATTDLAYSCACTTFLFPRDFALRRRI
jgi:hypothetical protein